MSFVTFFMNGGRADFMFILSLCNFISAIFSNRALFLYCFVGRDKTNRSVGSIVPDWKYEMLIILTEAFPVKVSI